MRTLSKVFKEKIEFDEKGNGNLVSDYEIDEIASNLMAPYYIASDIEFLGYEEGDGKDHLVFVTYGYDEGKDEFSDLEESLKDLRETVHQVHKVFLANELKKLNQKD